MGHIDADATEEARDLVITSTIISLIEPEGHDTERISRILRTVGAWYHITLEESN